MRYLAVCNAFPPGVGIPSYDDYDDYYDLRCEDECRDSTCQFCLCECKFECLDTC